MGRCFFGPELMCFFMVCCVSAREWTASEGLPCIFTFFDSIEYQYEATMMSDFLTILPMSGCASYSPYQNGCFVFLVHRSTGWYPPFGISDLPRTKGACCTSGVLPRKTIRGMDGATGAYLETMDNILICRFLLGHRASNDQVHLNARNPCQRSAWGTRGERFLNLQCWP